MEMNGEQIIKKGKKLPKWIIGGYIICILAAIISIGVMTYREENEKPEPIDFTTNGAVDMATDQYAYLEVNGLTDEVAIYGDTKNENSENNDRYYIAINDGYLYVVDLDFETIDELKQIQEYTYSTDPEIEMPEIVTIYGMTESVPQELQQMVVDYYNESVGEEYAISVDQFEMYFGSVLLNVRRSPVDTSVEQAIFVISLIAFFIIVILHIVSSVTRGKIKKYLKNNNYEEELAQQLDDFVEEKHYNDKIILTRDFFVDLKNGLAAFKYTDVKWLHIHNVKYYGVFNVSSSIIVHLKDGKTNIQCVEIRGKATDEFMEIFHKICEKVPQDAFKGYTPENIKAYKEYKKSLKNNKI